MKLALFLLFEAAGIALALNATPPATPALQETDLPDARFTVELDYDSVILPVDPTLANMIYFMSIVARHDFYTAVPPHAYSSLTYPEVVITGFSSIQARFLLWAIYLAARDMIKFAKFNNAVVDLYWLDGHVGQLKITFNSGAQSTGTIVDTTRFVAGSDGGFSVIGTGNGTDEGFTEAEVVQTPSVNNITVSKTPSNNLTADSVLVWEKSPSRPLTRRSSNTRLTVEFVAIPSAARLRRNGVFLAFYTAILHVAKFPTTIAMTNFDSRALAADIRVRLYNKGTGCSYGQALIVLSYIPLFMMENPTFGYRETNFIIRLSGVRACKGSIADSLLSDD